jgi:hypothetical protein
MKMKLAVAFAVLLCARIARADGTTYVYTYTGNQLANTNALDPVNQNSIDPTPFPSVPPCNCSLDGWLSTAGPALAPGFQEATIPLSWSFTDGDYTLTPANSTIQAIYSGDDPSGIEFPGAGLNGNGLQNDWSIGVFGAGEYSGLEFSIMPDFFRLSCVCSGWDDVILNGQVIAYQENEPGAWTIRAPEPNSLGFLAIGLAFLFVCGCHTRLALPQNRTTSDLSARVRQN